MKLFCKLTIVCLGLSILMSCGAWRPPVNREAGIGFIERQASGLSAVEAFLLNPGIGGPLMQHPGSTASDEAMEDGEEGAEGWNFQPAFFLWPLNLIRTPLGLIGAGYTQVVEWLHWGWIFIVRFAVEGLTAYIGRLIYFLSIPATFFLSPPTRAAYQAFLYNTVPQFLGSVFRSPFYVLEFPLYLYLWLGNPPEPPEGTVPIERHIYYHVPGWVQAQWRFAWNYQLYPPFMFWPESSGSAQ